MSSMRLYELKMWKDDELVRDFIPCYRKSDNVIGLYDLVNNEFYTNQGTGEFLKGENKDTIVGTSSGNQDFISEEDYIFDIAGGNENVEDLPPAAYQQVEYIENTGTQYIDTRFIPSNNTSIEMKVSNRTASNACLYCARGISGFTDNTYTAFLISRVLRVDYYNKQYENIITTTADTTYVYKQQKNLVYLNGELKKTLEESEFSSEYNMFLMASHQGGTNISNIPTMKLYYCKIWDDETLVRDMVPCYRISDNVVGMYDKVNDVFYTNAGTGTFEKGPNVN